MKRFFITLALAAAVAVPVKAASPHVVKDGGSLWGIAREYGVSFQALVEANPQITSLDLIYPGAKIIVPEKGQTAAERVKRYYDAKRLKVENAKTTRTAQADKTTTAPAAAAAPPAAAAPAPAAAPAEQTADDQTPAALPLLQGPSVADGDVAGGDEADFALRIVELENISRAAVGIAPLRVNENLARVARYKAADMGESVSFDHNSLVYGTPFEMIRSFGIDYSSAGENIAKGFADPGDVYTAWLMSEGHRANVLDPGFTETGVGLCVVDGVTYWTQIFIN